MQQCGLCSALAEVFRRLLCIGGSRRGSGQSYYQELDDDETRRNGISIDRSEHGLFIRMVDPSGPLPSRSKRLSQSDWLLLETLDTRHKRPYQTGRFLTMHKRRRKRLITRSLTQDHALLDDIHHGQVQCVLDKVNQWPFNAFILDNVTGGRSLPVLCVHLFHWYGLLDYFKLDVVRCWKFFTLIEEGYHSTNPYHNSIHATDVTQAMHCFLQEKKIREYLTPLEIMASLIAAVTHDLDHPGVNQPFLIATSNHLAALYENSSVLENHHWRSAIGCLLESHVAEELEDCRPELQKQISSLILATDITRQQEFIVRFKRYLDQDLLDMKLEEHRHFILQIALKCADISNPCRPWEVSKKWSQKVCEEFFRQGDYERQLNLPVTALCDRQSTSVPKIQTGFLTFVVYPLFEEWHRFLGDGLSDDMMRNLHGNKLKWDALMMQENTDGNKMENPDEVSTEEEVKECSRQDAPSCPESSSVIPKISKRTHFSALPKTNCQHKVGRRHSVPLSVPDPPVVSWAITRRESLAIGEKKSRTNFQSGLLVEEDEEDEKELTGLGQSSLSLLSNNSGGDGGGGGGGGGESDETVEREKRPLSSENLLPDLSITSITTVTEASRLSSVLNKGRDLPNSGGRSQLTRQQTFPPIQTCFRQRYFSTTAEMSKCTNAEMEKLKASTSGGEREEPEKKTPDAHCGTKRGCKTPPPPPKVTILKESNRPTFKLGEGEKQTSSKREMDGCSREKGVKVAKLFDDGLPDSFEKENVDPRGFANDFEDNGSLFNRSGSVRKTSTQGHLSRRRGSAPVGSEIVNPTALALRGCNDRYRRRGSVPVDAIRCNTYDENLRMAQDFSLCSSQQHCPFQRRGSIPAETGCPETSKPRINRSKKTLRRRRSGGPEMFSFSENGNENVRWKMEILPKRPGGESLADSMTTRRRGSLPVDALLATHSGDHRETHDS